MTAKVLSQESVAAFKHIREMRLDNHGVVDIFAKYRKVDVAMSLLALGRLQERRRRRLWTKGADEGGLHSSYPLVDDAQLIDDLAHYAVFANAAYGWKMELAFGRGLWNPLQRGDLHTVLRSTQIAEEDVIACKWQSRAHRPAYFVVRDCRRKAIVLCVRGTWSPHDILTDLCFTADEVEIPGTRRSLLGLGSKGQPRVVRAHHGMLEAAQTVKDDVEDILLRECEANSDYKLVLVGHSMGGGVCSVLSILWEGLFPDLKVYIYGAPCVVPLEFQSSVDGRIISVIAEDDPFSCLSLGHVADITSALSVLCEDEELRSEILRRTNHQPDNEDKQVLDWCSKVMSEIRSNHMTSEKMFPPGRIFLLRTVPSNTSIGGAGKKNRFSFGMSRRETVELRQVPPEYFEDLWVRPRMFDLTVHVPFKYIRNLRKLSDEIIRAPIEFI